MKIVRATIRHLDQVAPLFDAYRVFYQEPSRPRAARAFIRARLKSRDSVILLAQSGSKGKGSSAVGFIQLYPAYDSTAMRRLWILNDLFVVPTSRRQGVAEALMERARDWAIQTKAKGLILETAVDNLPGQRLYEKLGYRRDTKFHRYFVDV